jgi:cation diffusion facilitator family transporter
MFKLAPQQRTALLSVIAAGGLVAVKLTVGLLAHSLGLVAEAIHSATDMVAALLTFFALGVAVRPADRDHPYGHGKAEHLSALAEGAVLVVASLVIVVESIIRLSGSGQKVDVHWYVLAILGVVILTDAGRLIASRRTAMKYSSPALRANALHFMLDMVGSLAVLLGLVLVRAGYPQADSIAALLVAALVLFTAGRLMRGNVRVLMDSAPRDGAQALVREAIAGIEEAVSVRRLRMREVAGKHFADVVVGVEPDAAVAHGHAVANAIEEAIERELPGSDVIVHVEPDAGLGLLRQQATAAALAVGDVREVHNVTVLRVEESTELALHMKVPSVLTLRAAHDIASEVEEAVLAAVPQVVSVQTHIEPLTDDSGTKASHTVGGEAQRSAVCDVVRELTGGEPRSLRFRQTEDGLRAFLTLGLSPQTTLVDAHTVASEIEQRVRGEHPEIIDVLIHTEPA